MKTYLELLTEHKRYMRDVLSGMSLGDMRKNDEFISSLYQTEDYLIGKVSEDKTVKEVDEILARIEQVIKDEFGLTKEEFRNKALNYLAIY